MNGGQDRDDGFAAGTEALPAGRYALALLLFGFVCAVSVPAGFMHDDLMLARLGRDSSWGDIWVLRIAPLPFHLSIWKLAAALSPGNPPTVVHVITGVLHAAVFLLFTAAACRLTSRRYFWLFAAFFTGCRPGNEAVLWAAGNAEVVMSLFVLAALLAWLRAGDGSRAAVWKCISALCMVAATLAKPSAVVMPVVLLAYELWLAGPPQDRAERLRRSIPVLLACLVVVLAIAAGASRNPGHWQGVYTKPVDRVRMVATFGEMLFRGLFVFGPRGFADTNLIGFALTALAGAVLLVAPYRVRFGLFWMGAFLAPSLYATGELADRYHYSGMFGAALVMAGLWEAAVRAGPPWKPAARAAGAGWLLLCALLYVRDVRDRVRCGAFNAGVRETIRQHAAEIRSAGVLNVSVHHTTIRPDDILKYDVGSSLRTDYPEVCPPADVAGAGCLAFSRSVASVRECPAPGEPPVFSWRSSANP